MKYRKETKSKPFLGSGGPRDQQRRQNREELGGDAYASVVEELRHQIVELRKELTIPKDNYTGEQVDREIRKAVESALKETGKADPERLAQLEEEIISLKNNVNDKDVAIQALSSVKTDGSIDLMELLTTQSKQIEQLTQALEIREVDIDPNRPKMQEMIIDPTNEKEGLESHIDIKDVSFSEQTDMGAKVDKLKNLLGKLPSQK